MSKTRITDYFGNQNKKIILESQTNEADELTEKDDETVEVHGERIAIDENREADETQTEEQSSHVAKSLKTKFVHKFQSSWLSTYPWLLYNEQKDTMNCELCIRSGKTNTFTDGCCNFRTSTLNRHVKSSDHQKSLKDCQLRENMATCTETAISKKYDAVIGAMQTVYFMGKEGIATAKYPKFIEFLSEMNCPAVLELNCGSNATYTSRHIADEFQGELSSAIQENLNELMLKSDYISVMTDESTDISVNKKLVVYVKLLNKNELETHFIGNLLIKEASVTAAVLFTEIQLYLERHGVSMSKVIAFGSDGASIMTGHKRGVAARIKEVSPHCINIHCMAHRLNLCTSKAAEAVPFIKKTFEKTLTDLYYYFKHSTSRIVSLSQIQKVLEDPEVRLKEVHQIRWFSFYSALSAVYHSWVALVMFLKKQKNSKAISLLENITDFRFVYTLHLMMDVIPSFTQLNMVFQKVNLDIAAVKPAVEGCLNDAKMARGGHTYYQKMFKENTTVEGRHVAFKKQKLGYGNLKETNSECEKIRKDFIDSLTTKVERRFPKDSTDIATSLEIFGMRNLSFLSRQEVLEFGNDRLDILLNHYGADRTCGDVVSNRKVDPDKCRLEWKLVKSIVLEQRYPRDNTKLLWNILRSNHEETLGEIMKLSDIGLLLPLQTADCERGFSAQNNLHTSKRNTLSAETLNRLLLIQLEGPAMKDFDFKKCVKSWQSKKDRRILKK